MSKKAVIKARAILGFMLLCGAAAIPARFKIAADETAVITISENMDFLQPFVENATPARSHFKGVTAINHMHQSEIPPRYETPQQEYISQLADFNYLIGNIFLTDPRTILLETDVNAQEFLENDFTVDNESGGAKILIFHTHSREMYADSDPDDPMTGVFGVGRYLAEILETQYGIETLHHIEAFDVVDGVPDRNGSYERGNPAVSRILADNPSIEIVIDLHRDGVGAHVEPMVTYIDGQRAAQIMFVNGLSRRYRNGEILPVVGLPNPYQRENLAFSFNLQIAANQLYPGLARRIYLLEYRYSLHMAARSILIEVGAQNNTFGEALNAMPPFANILASVVLGD